MKMSRVRWIRRLGLVTVMVAVPFAVVTTPAIAWPQPLRVATQFTVDVPVRASGERTGEPPITVGRAFDWVYADCYQIGGGQTKIWFSDMSGWVPSSALTEQALLPCTIFE